MTYIHVFFSLVLRLLFPVFSFRLSLMLMQAKSRVARPPFSSSRYNAHTLHLGAVHDSMVVLLPLLGFQGVVCEVVLPVNMCIVCCNLVMILGRVNLRYTSVANSSARAVTTRSNRVLCL